MATKRIIDHNTDSVLSVGDYVLIDSSSEGTRKYDLGNAVTGLQTTANLVTSVSASSTDSQYPSAKLLYDTVGNIETLLAAI